VSPTDAARERAATLADAPRSRLFHRVRGSAVAARVVDAVVRTALPPVCAGCGVSGHWMCPVCDQCIRRISLDSVCKRCGSFRDEGTACERCTGWSPALASCRSAYVFDGAVRKSIHDLKYHGEFARAEWCGREVARLVIELGWRPDFLVPVPLHRSRLRSRGYNQSAKIASVVASSIATPFGNVLVRTRATLAQVGLDAAGRRENVQGAFACPHDLSDLSILLVDDVVTTGSTLEACAVACRQAGAKDVWAVTVATGT
jgi:ComF family protein